MQVKQFEILYFYRIQRTCLDVCAKRHAARCYDPCWYESITDLENTDCSGFVLFVCEANDTDYLGPAFGAPLLIRSAISALDASCDCAWHDQASVHRGCGRAVRTLRTFSYDRAAPSAPVLCFLCAKQINETDYLGPAFLVRLC